jgi:hypothetical protein
MRGLHMSYCRQQVSDSIDYEETQVNQDKRMLVACDVCGMMKITDNKEGMLVATLRGA